MKLGRVRTGFPSMARACGKAGFPLMLRPSYGGNVPCFYVPFFKGMLSVFVRNVFRPCSVRVPSALDNHWNSGA